MRAWAVRVMRMQGTRCQVSALLARKLEARNVSGLGASGDLVDARWRSGRACRLVYSLIDALNLYSRVLTT